MPEDQPMLCEASSFKRLLPLPNVIMYCHISSVLQYNSFPAFMETEAAHYNCKGSSALLEKDRETAGLLDAKKNQGFPLLSCPKHSVNIIKQTPSVQWLLEMQTQHWRNTITTVLFHSFACWSHFNTPYSHLNNSTLILLVVCRTQILSDAKDTKI